MPDRDLPEKLKLEKQFEDLLEPLFAVYLIRYRKAVLSGQALPSLDFLQEDFRFSLERHYRRTQDVFRTRAFQGIDPVEFNGKAQEAFEKLMDDWRVAVATERAALIVATNQIEAEDALERANGSLSAGEEPFSITDVANLSGLILKRKFDQRRALLGVMETQAASESTKDLKAEALRITPELAIGYLTFKVWNSQHDGRVRGTHVAADTQEQPSNQPFKVGGSDLRYPGDPAGPIREIANCRCYTTSYVVQI